MAIVSLNGDNYDGFYNQEPRQAMPKGDAAGEIKVLRDEIAIPALISATSTIDFGFIPEGSRIVDAKLIIPATLGATGIFTMGFDAHVDQDGSAVVADPNALILSADAGGQAVFARMIAAAAGYGVKIGSGGAQINVTCTEAGVAAGQMYIEVHYIND